MLLTVHARTHTVWRVDADADADGRPFDTGGPVIPAALLRSAVRQTTYARPHSSTLRGGNSCSQTPSGIRLHHRLCDLHLVRSDDKLAHSDRYSVAKKCRIRRT